MNTAGFVMMNSAAKANGQAGLVVLSTYLSAPFRRELRESRISYADATGWVWLVSDNPMLAVTATGASRAPKAATRRRTLSLKGASAGRLVCALLSSSPPIGVRELADAAAVSPGTVSKTLPLLTSESALNRDDSGKITAVFPRRVLERWVLDYQVLASNAQIGYYIAPRGIDKAQAALAARQGIAFTMLQGARAYLPADTMLLIPPTQIVSYVNDIGTTSTFVGLHEVDASSANVILIAPQDKALLDQPAVIGGVPVAPLPLVLADLMTLPGRYPAQANALMDALAKTDPEWRRQ